MGIIETNPLFINIDQWYFDYQDNSPCIDAGDPSDEDPDGSIRDIGAHWFSSEDVPLGDCNADGTQNVIDIIIMINNCILGEDENCECGDMNQDGIVNILDIVQLVNLILAP